MKKIEKATWYMVKTLIFTYCAWSFTHGHVSDGNVWGIYSENSSLKVGDFWAALLFFFSSAMAISGIKELIEVFIND